MRQRRDIRMTISFRAGIAALLLGGGMLNAQQHRFRDPCATIPPGAMPAQNGSSVRAWFGQQAALAEEDDFVIYAHEWFMGGTRLGPYDAYHLNQIICRLPTVPFHVIIQPEG